MVVNFFIRFRAVCYLFYLLYNYHIKKRGVRIMLNKDMRDFKQLSDNDLQAVSGGKGFLSWASKATSWLVGPQQPGSPLLKKHR